jgi:hypothetical protein
VLTVDRRGVASQRVRHVIPCCAQHALLRSLPDAGANRAPGRTPGKQRGSMDAATCGKGSTSWASRRLSATQPGLRQAARSARPVDDSCLLAQVARQAAAESSR